MYALWLLVSNAEGLIILSFAMGSLPGGYCREVISIAAIAVELERAMASQAWRPTSTLQNSPTMPPTRFPPAMHSPKACVAVPICIPWPHSAQATNIAVCICSCCSQVFELVSLLLQPSQRRWSGLGSQFETTLLMWEHLACSTMSCQV